jgi:AraC family transcriptional regulator, regulatory protein of adaptative response / methylated-DNA-[protein]-cysteine methyltransferase
MIASFPELRMATESLRYCFLSTSVGRVLLVVSPRGIRSLRLADLDGDEQLLAEVRQEETAPLNRDPSLRREWSDRIEDVLSGAEPSTSLPLDLVGTPFQVSVWKALCEIPYGETRSYSEIAAAIGAPKASRAVGSACGKNRICTLVPCHRVLGKGGEMGGFNWGPHIKRRLIERERTGTGALVS